MFNCKFLNCSIHDSNTGRKINYLKTVYFNNFKLIPRHIQSNNALEDCIN